MVGKRLLGKVASLLCGYPRGKKFRQNRSISHHFLDILDFSDSLLRKVMVLS